MKRRYAGMKRMHRSFDLRLGAPLLRAALRMTDLLEGTGLQA